MLLPIHPRDGSPYPRSRDPAHLIWVDRRIRRPSFGMARFGESNLYGSLPFSLQLALGAMAGILPGITAGSSESPDYLSYPCTSGVDDANGRLSSQAGQFAILPCGQGRPVRLYGRTLNRFMPASSQFVVTYRGAI
ncbi:hypothetical protein FA13DRAFT_674631 [Coprinellus micaceus]|uniref:Uncharacterized protein n=1 Tax=Coprinellus micaceus TaxID=71717 RepID=A0A4Y7T5U5_COPMI|nr:hypothetical protein FA13DRAFT_674631 [Coprinellus micaceus]